MFEKTLERRAADYREPGAVHLHPGFIRHFELLTHVGEQLGHGVEILRADPDYQAGSFHSELCKPARVYRFCRIADPGSEF
jgi:hypothetical protein